MKPRIPLENKEPNVKDILLTLLGILVAIQLTILVVLSLIKEFLFLIEFFNL